MILDPQLRWCWDLLQAVFWLWNWLHILHWQLRGEWAPLSIPWDQDLASFQSNSCGSSLFCLPHKGNIRAGACFVAKMRGEGSWHFVWRTLLLLFSHLVVSDFSWPHGPENKEHICGLTWLPFATFSFGRNDASGQRWGTSRAELGALEIQSFLFPNLQIPYTLSTDGYYFFLIHIVMFRTC